MASTAAVPPTALTISVVAAATALTAERTCSGDAPEADTASAVVLVAAAATLASVDAGASPCRTAEVVPRTALALRSVSASTRAEAGNPAAASCPTAAACAAAQPDPPEQALSRSAMIEPTS